MTIWLASGNLHKQQELAAILGGHRLALPAEGGITNFDPAETGSSFAENALIKARALYALLAAGPFAGRAVPPVLADDSGLCVDALGGRPGIFSARYCGRARYAGPAGAAGSPGAAPGEKLDSARRNALLLDELNAALEAASGVAGGLPAGTPGVAAGAANNRSCRFVCAMALLLGPERFRLVQETLEGELVASASEVRGSGGFGYDPIVYVPEFGRTVAELSEAEKNAASHRGKACRAIARFLEEFDGGVCRG